MPYITVSELKNKLAKGEPIRLIDVREEYEYEAGDLGGEKMPIDTIRDDVGRIPKDVPVVFYCHTGERSNKVCAYLETTYGFANLYSLSGGIKAWLHETEPEA